MKIVFLGDSITEGVPGVSYVDIIRNATEDFEIVNRGKGGDTVESLLKRVYHMSDLNSFDVFVLFVGINDIFGTLTWQYKFLKALKKQTATKSIVQFEASYSAILNYLSSFNKKIIVVPPLLLGEEVNSNWNQQVAELVSVIEKVVMENKDARFLDIRKVFIDVLKNRDISSYMPLSILELGKDVTRLKTAQSVDQKSKERGLHVTLDGVHINSEGANIIASNIVKELHKTM